MTIKHLKGPQNISSTSTYISASHSVARNCEMHPESEGEWPQAILSPRRQLQCFLPLAGKFFDVSHLYLEHSYAIIRDPLHNTSAVLRLELALQSPLVPRASSPIHLTMVPQGEEDILLSGHHKLQGTRPPPSTASRYRTFPGTVSHRHWITLYHSLKSVTSNSLLLFPALFQPLLWLFQ